MIAQGSCGGVLVFGDQSIAHLKGDAKVKPCVANVKYETSNLKPQTSNLKPQTSNLNPQASTLNPQIGIRKLLLLCQ